MFYLLTEIADVSKAGHCPSADDLLLIVGKWTSEPQDEVYVFDSGEWQKDSSLWKAIKLCHWDDVVLSPTMKRSLIDDIHGFFGNKALYRRYAAPWKRGIIFHGPPGNGKTMSIKALMNSLDEREDAVASLVVKRFDSSCQDPQDGLKSIFEHARTMAPCLLVFEDLYSLVVDKVRSYFLNEVDGLEGNDGILMIGSTNHLERLDAGISRRPSRFDRKYHFRLPNENERLQYCKYWRAKLDAHSDVDFDSAVCEAVAKLTEGFSFAYLTELVLQTLLTLARANEVHNVDNVEIHDKTGEFDGVEPDQQANNSDGVEQALGVDASFNSGDRATPQVFVSEHLLANVLMRVFRDQVIALRRDMKDSDGGELDSNSQIYVNA